MSKLRSNKPRYRDLILFEHDTSFPSPTLGLLVSVFLILGFAVVSTPGVMIPFSSDVYIESTPDWNGTIQVGIFENTTRDAPNNVYGAALFNEYYGVIFFSALLISFIFAQGYSNGQYRTVLSYPISRRKLLMAKISGIYLIVTISSNLSALFVLACYVPSSIEIGVLLIMSLSLWTSAALVVASCTLVAVVTKSAPLTTIISLGMWFVAFYNYTTPATTPILEGVKNLLIPLYAILRHTTSLRMFSYLQSIPTFTECILSIILAGVFSIILFVMSAFIFERTEI